MRYDRNMVTRMGAFLGMKKLPQLTPEVEIQLSAKIQEGSAMQMFKASAQYPVFKALVVRKQLEYVDNITNPRNKERRDEWSYKHEELKGIFNIIDKCIEDGIKAQKTFDKLIREQQPKEKENV